MRRFEKAFDAWSRRVQVEDWNNRKIAIIAALYANSNLDQEDVDRGEIVKSVEEQHEEIKKAIWDFRPGDEKQQEKQSDFMLASMRSRPRLPPKLPGEDSIGGL